jgi:hypothetical protein
VEWAIVWITYGLIFASFAVMGVGLAWILRDPAACGTVAVDHARATPTAVSDLAPK